MSWASKTEFDRRPPAPQRGLFHGHWTKPADKAAAENNQKPNAHAVENRKKQLLQPSGWFSTCCEDVENRSALPIP